jgi:hypothetical protein
MTLVVDRLQDDGTGNSDAVQDIIDGRAKVWGAITFSGGTPTLQQSHNVSSVTDVGVGVTDFNFSTSYASSRFSAATSNNESANNNIFAGTGDVSSTRTNVNGSVDNDNSVSTFGTLA